MDENIKGYKKLRVYEEGNKLVISVYAATAKFPKHETFGLVSQMRRAVVSVVANIIEGYVRGSREFRQFLVIANGSLAELEYYLDLSLELGYLDKKEYADLLSRKTAAGSMLGGLVKSINKKLNS
jgi:four helix bundle protein